MQLQHSLLAFLFAFAMRYIKINASISREFISDNFDSSTAASYKSAVDDTTNFAVFLLGSFGDTTQETGSTTVRNHF